LGNPGHGTDVCRNARVADSVSEKDELLTKEVITELQKVLNTSDLVKFAKYVPAENENEESLALAVKFVTSTARSKKLKTRKNNYVF
jgi:hypothetical protein